MFKQRNKEFDSTIFVPGLPVYVDFAEGLIAICGRIAGFFKSLTYGRIEK